MSKWQDEPGYIARYIGSGAFNTLIGFAVIFAAMWAGFSPVAANIAGYGVGFILGFVISKKLIFRSGGSLGTESVRYLVAFAIAFAANILTLKFAIAKLGLGAGLAQLLAAAAYTISMYLLARHFVFRPKSPAKTHKT